MVAHPRPLSPHLQIWRWGLHMALSIAHRATGIANAVAAVGLVWWLYAIAAGPEAYDRFAEIAGSIPGRLVLFGLTLSLTLHLCTGVRHLVMDTGRALEPAANKRAGVLAILAALVLTVGIWLVGYRAAGLL